MKKIFQKIGVWLIAMTLIMAVITAILVYVNFDSLKVFINPPTLPKKAPSEVKVPDFQALATQQSGVAAPTEAQIKEENQIITEQVATAGIWLSSIDAEQRRNGAEQLSAYPTPAAETLLIKALSDNDVSVRSAAAESLAAFEILSHSAVTALLAAMEDANENVQLNALSTLENQISNEENGSKRYQMIMRGLRKKAKSARLSEEMRKAVDGFIKDQQQ
jgi:HEAT repeats